MSAYKKLNKQDSFITTYIANKAFNVTASDHSALGIETHIGVSGSSDFFPSTSTKRLVGTNFEHYEHLVYNSIKHLYYSGFDNGEPSSSSLDQSGSAMENYLQSSYRSQQRRAADRFTIISIPRNLVGTGIQPNTFTLRPDSTELYSSGSFTPDSSDSYTEDGDEQYGGNVDQVSTIEVGDDYHNFITEYVNYTEQEFADAAAESTRPWSTTIIDDGNGNLILSASANYNPIIEQRLPRVVVGNIIYPHGLAILTQPAVADYYASYFSGSLDWRATHPIYTYNFHCTIKESEYLFTSNPSALKDTSGSLADNITGSEFTPYFTTVGLYNETNELIAVAKMAQPVPVSDNTEMTVVVKLDM